MLVIMARTTQTMSSTDLNNVCISTIDTVTKQLYNNSHNNPTDISVLLGPAVLTQVVKKFSDYRTSQFNTMFKITYNPFLSCITNTVQNFHSYFSKCI